MKKKNLTTQLRSEKNSLQSYVDRISIFLLKKNKIGFEHNAILKFKVIYYADSTTTIRTVAGQGGRAAGLLDL